MTMPAVNVLSQQDVDLLYETWETATDKNAFDLSTPRGRLLSLHHRLSQEARLLMEKKNADYASEADPFANFRGFGAFGILVRLSDKLARLRTFVERRNYAVEDESFRDTVLDVINYAVLLQGMVDEKR